MDSRCVDSECGLRAGALLTSRPTIDMDKDNATIFREVFKEISFPFLAADLDVLRMALTQGHKSSRFSFRVIGVPDRRHVVAASLAGLLGKIDVPDALTVFLSESRSIKRAGLAEKLRRMGSDLRRSPELTQGCSREMTRTETTICDPDHATRSERAGLWLFVFPGNR